VFSGSQTRHGGSGSRGRDLIFEVARRVEARDT